MQTKTDQTLTGAAKRFIGTSDRDNSKLFTTWYAGNDIARILGQLYINLNPELKNQIEHPWVICDGFSGRPLDKVLNPLMAKLSKSNKKYLPFIFKPELGATHYMAGFLRKNKDGSISTVIFNPTGTKPRINYGKYAYTIESMQYMDALDAEFETNTIYVKTDTENRVRVLCYTVIAPNGDETTSTLTKEDLSGLGIDVDLSKPLDRARLELLKNNIDNLLKITTERGHTERRHLILSQSKVQTLEKDGEQLVSCGPICIEFLEAIMNNPTYMRDLGEEFTLPDVIEKLIPSPYKDAIIAIRMKHFNLLNQIPDPDPDSKPIDVNQIPNVNSIDAVHEVLDYEISLEFNPELANSSEASTAIKSSSAPAASPSSPAAAASISTSAPASDIKTAPKNTQDKKGVEFINEQISRYEANAQFKFTMNNKKKAGILRKALSEAMKDESCTDVRRHSAVVKALAFHRIFSFFGRDTKASQLLNLDLKKTP